MSEKPAQMLEDAIDEVLIWKALLPIRDAFVFVCRPHHWHGTTVCWRCGATAEQVYGDDR